MTISWQDSLPAHRRAWIPTVTQLCALAARDMGHGGSKHSKQNKKILSDHGLLNSHPHLNPRSSSGATTSMSESETDSDNDGCSADPIIDLTYERLQSLHANGTVCKKDLTEYAKRGTSASRIKSAVLHPQCRCMCKMPIKILYHLCVAFWTLSKSTQDSLLWGIQHESGKQKRKRWYLGGQLFPSKQIERINEKFSIFQNQIQSTMFI